MKLDSIKKLITWSEGTYSDLPWRKKRSLYGTLVSEIMLQQTTVSTVLSHFDRFLKQYPNTKELAKSTEEEVCIAWKGLGYYRRARNLRKAAIDIEELYKGKIPLELEKLKAISGVGDYTANAIRAIGADEVSLAIDANLERVLARIYGIEVEKGPKLLKAIAGKFNEGIILPNMEKIGPRKINEALMDLGRVYCQARKANCTLCPVSASCVSFKENKVDIIPVVNEEKKKEKFFELKLLRVIVQKKNKVLGYVKSEKEWLSGQVEIPTFIIESEDESLKQYPKLSKKMDIDKMKKYKTSITKYKISNYVIHLSEKEFSALTNKEKGFSFYPIENKESNFTTASYKAFKYL